MTDYAVRCGEEDHVVRIEGRRLSCPHHDVRAEMALLAMGGRVCVCLAVALNLEYETWTTVREKDESYLNWLWDPEDKKKIDIVNLIVADSADWSKSILRERGQLRLPWEKRERLVLDWGGE